MKEIIEKKAYCHTDEARTFIRRRIATQKNLSKQEIISRPDAINTVLRYESLEALPDDKLALEIFFSEEIPEVRIAKEVCLQCSVMKECLLNAIENEIDYGIWGGQFFRNGIIEQPKRRGRPPKVLRPEFEVLDVPISSEIKQYIKQQQKDPQAA